MTGRPSIVSDYVSVILRTIEKTQNDPARLRSLVYDVARLSLGKHLLTTYHQIGSAGLQQHVADLETAITHVEDFAQKQLPDLSKKIAQQRQIADVSKKAQDQIAELSKKALEQIAELSKKAQDQIADSSNEEPLQGQIAANSSKNEPSQEQTEAVADLAAQLLDGKVTAPDHNAITVRDTFEETIFDATRSNKAPVVVEPLPTEVYTGRAEILQPLDFRPPAFGSGPKRPRLDFGFGLQLTFASLIGLAIYAVSLVGLEYGGRHSSGTAPVQNASAAPAPASAKPSAAEILGFPLPKVYGVYAASEGKLYELDPLPLKVPDPRVAISAIISNPSELTIPAGKLQFIIFRRDLVASAPTEVFVRVVARVARELKFTGTGPPTTTNIDGEWAIRSKSYTLRVAPLGDNPEMVTLRAADPEFSLSPGRYVLVLAGKGYDFTIEGQVTDAAQCLERTNVVGGIVYSECGGAAKQLAN